MKKTHVRIAALLALVGIFVTSAQVTVAQQNVVIAYQAAPEWANTKEVMDKFQQATGIRVPIDNKNSGQALTQLLAERNNPQADIGFNHGITFAIKGAADGLYAPYKPKHWADVPSDLKDPDGLWFTIYTGTIGFAVNKEALGAGVPVPRSWDDLLKPIYRGKIGILDPSSAFVGYVACAAANLAHGGTLDNWDPGVAYLKKLFDNAPMTPKQTSYARVVKGEIPIMIDYDFNAYRMRYDDKVDVEWVVPKEGTITVPYVAYLVKGAARVDNGKKFLDFLLDDPGQAAFARGFVRPVRPSAMDAQTQAKFLPASEYARARAVDYRKMADAMTGFQNRYLKEVAR
ncbi:MAG TPA: extracellular solute-binding protein [Burkholderiaceae bacterium]|nr:extracellular solute-binding protein [Burkholderiaceae bacterium]